MCRSGWSEAVHARNVFDRCHGRILSMAGLPPLFGFLAKETLLAAAIHPSLPVSWSAGYSRGRGGCGRVQICTGWPGGVGHLYG